MNPNHDAKGEFSSGKGGAAGAAAKALGKGKGNPMKSQLAYQESRTASSRSAAAKNVRPLSVEHEAARHAAKAETKALANDHEGARLAHLDASAAHIEASRSPGQGEHMRLAHRNAAEQHQRASVRHAEARDAVGVSPNVEAAANIKRQSESMASGRALGAQSSTDIKSRSPAEHHTEAKDHATRAVVHSTNAKAGQGAQTASVEALASSHMAKSEADHVAAAGKHRVAAAMHNGGPASLAHTKAAQAHDHAVMTMSKAPAAAATSTLPANVDPFSRYEPNGGMTATVRKPLAVHVTDGTYQETNASYGNSRISQAVMKPHTLQPGDEIHHMPGGTFTKINGELHGVSFHAQSQPFERTNHPHTVDTMHRLEKSGHIEATGRGVGNTASFHADYQKFNAKRSQPPRQSVRSQMTSAQKASADSTDRARAAAAAQKNLGRPPKEVRRAAAFAKSNAAFRQKVAYVAKNPTWPTTRD